MCEWSCNLTFALTPQPLILAETTLNTHWIWDTDEILPYSLVFKEREWGYISWKSCIHKYLDVLRKWKLCVNVMSLEVTTSLYFPISYETFTSKTLRCDDPSETWCRTLNICMAVDLLQTSNCYWGARTWSNKAGIRDHSLRLMRVSDDILELTLKILKRKCPDSGIGLYLRIQFQ